LRTPAQGTLCWNHKRSSDSPSPASDIKDTFEYPLYELLTTHNRERDRLYDTRGASTGSTSERGGRATQAPPHIFRFVYSLSDMPFANISLAEGLEAHPPPSEHPQSPDKYNTDSLLEKNSRAAQLRPVTSQTTAVTSQEDMIKQQMAVSNFINPSEGVNCMIVHPLKRLSKLISASSKFQVITQGVLFRATVYYRISNVSCSGAYE
jgi:hypothetical protein